MNEIHQPTLAELINDKIDVQTAIDKILKSFALKYYNHKITLELRYINGDPQVTVNITV
jgi:hypothetical protein